MKLPIYISAAVAVLMFGGVALAEETSAKLPAFKQTKIAAVDSSATASEAVTEKSSSVESGTATESTPEAEKVAAPKKVKPKPVPTTLVASIDLSNQRLTVKEYGKVKYVWKISSGRAGYRTPTGTYRPKWMSRMHYSRKYDNAPMPHSVFFHRGYAIHATYATSRLGAPASHGCIRLAPSNARKFYKLVQKHKMAGTRVSLRGVARDTKRSYAKKKIKLPKYSAYKKPSGYVNSWSFAPPKYSRSYTWPGDRPRSTQRRYRKKRRYSQY